MNRFFAIDKNDDLILDADALKHLKVVLRGINKEFIAIYEQKFYRCVLNKNNQAKIIEQINEDHELGFEVILAPSIIKFERFEWLLEKAIELGATRIIPIISQYVDHSLIKFEKFEKKYERFNKIMKSAAQQSFRNKLVTLDQPLLFSEALKIEAKNKILAHEKQDTNVKINFANINKEKESIIFFIGPEGGYSDEEIKSALSHDVKIVSLGKRILRAESASLYLLSQLKD